MERRRNTPGQGVPRARPSGRSVAFCIALTATACEARETLVRIDPVEVDESFVAFIPATAERILLERAQVFRQGELPVAWAFPPEASTVFLVGLDGARLEALAPAWDPAVTPELRLDAEPACSEGRFELSPDRQWIPIPGDAKVIAVELSGGEPHRRESVGRAEPALAQLRIVLEVEPSRCAPGRISELDRFGPEGGYLSDPTRTASVQKIRHLVRLSPDLVLACTTDRLFLADRRESRPKWTIELVAEETGALVAETKADERGNRQGALIVKVPALGFDVREFLLSSDGSLQWTQSATVTKLALRGMILDHRGTLVIGARGGEVLVRRSDESAFRVHRLPHALLGLEDLRRPDLPHGLTADDAVLLGDADTGSFETLALDRVAYPTLSIRGLDIFDTGSEQEVWMGGETEDQGAWIGRGSLTTGLVEQVHPQVWSDGAACARTRGDCGKREYWQALRRVFRTPNAEHVIFFSANCFSAFSIERSSLCLSGLSLPGYFASTDNNADFQGAHYDQGLITVGGTNGSIFELRLP